jgi:hypothetical protein
LAKLETMQAEIEAIDGNEMPLDHLLRVMRSPGENASVRFAAAKAAAPYCHPQLQDWKGYVDAPKPGLR